MDKQRSMRSVLVQDTANESVWQRQELQSIHNIIDQIQDKENRNKMLGKSAQMDKQRSMCSVLVQDTAKKSVRQRQEPLSARYIKTVLRSPKKLFPITHWFFYNKTYLHY
jgi:hypothetical protein